MSVVEGRETFLFTLDQNEQRIAKAKATIAAVYLETITGQTIHGDGEPVHRYLLDGEEVTIERAEWQLRSIEMFGHKIDLAFYAGAFQEMMDDAERSSGAGDE